MLHHCNQPHIDRSWHMNQPTTTRDVSARTERHLFSIETHCADESTTNRNRWFQTTPLAVATISNIHISMESPILWTVSDITCPGNTTKRTTPTRNDGQEALAISTRLASDELSTTTLHPKVDLFIARTIDMLVSMQRPTIRDRCRNMSILPKEKLPQRFKLKKKTETVVETVEKIDHDRTAS